MTFNDLFYFGIYLIGLSLFFGIWYGLRGCLWRKGKVKLTLTFDGFVALLWVVILLQL